MMWYCFKSLNICHKGKFPCSCSRVQPVAVKLKPKSVGKSSKKIIINISNDIANSMFDQIDWNNWVSKNLERMLKCFGWKTKEKRNTFGKSKMCWSVVAIGRHMAMSIRLSCAVHFKFDMWQTKFTQLKCTKQKICLIASNAGGEILPIADFCLFICTEILNARTHVRNPFASVRTHAQIFDSCKMPAKNIALDLVVVFFFFSLHKNTCNKFQNLF